MTPSRDPGPARTWDSWHLHADSAAMPVHDRIVVGVVAPAVTAVAPKPWFFIRYWQAGPHIRMRVGGLGEDERDRVDRLLRKELDSCARLRPGEEPVAADRYAEDAARLAAAGELNGALPVEDLLPSGVYRRPYEPELDRYGGAELMPATELLFETSSALVVGLLIKLNGAPGFHERAALALRAAMAAGAALGGEADAAEFYARSLRAWRQWGAGLGHSPEELDQMCHFNGEPPGPGRLPADHGPLTGWHGQLSALVQLLQRQSPLHPGQVLFSHVHMLHNRLGLHLPEELRTYAWLAHQFPASGDLEPMPSAGSRQ